MESAEPPEPESGSERPRLTPEDALRQLEVRLGRASEAAERLLAEATARAASAPPAGGGTEPRSGETAPQSGETAPQSGEAASQAGESETPAAGWQAPETESPSDGRDLELLLGIVRSVRDLIPAELQRRLAEALRELLLALRALIDWYLERAERRRAEPAEVEDIPIR
jgi:hypothetical protein